MGTPHYHQCTGDCPDGLSARAVAASAAGPAVDFWRGKLAQLDAAITNGARTRHLGVQHIAKHLRTEREHLAALLRALGVEVQELDEEKPE